VWAALPDEDAAARRLNEVLRATAGPPQLVRDARGWGLVVPDLRGRGPVAPDVGPAGAAVALAVLVVAGGWRRLRHCRRCGAPFVDRTNGASRQGCDRHRA
jgi:predicted RNA-binding Zn ribbon-like protein